MTRKQTQRTIDVTGLSVEDILKMDLYGLNTADTKAVASRLVSAVNKRIRRLAKSETGRTSPTYINFVQRGGNFFSIKGKDLNQTRETLKEMRNVMMSQTSSLTGWKKIRKKRKTRLENVFNVKMSNERWNDFWHIYNKAMEVNGTGNIVANLKKKYGSFQIQEQFLKYFKKHSKMSEDELIRNLTKSISYLNEKKGEYNEEKGIDADGNEFDYVFFDSTQD